MNKQYVVLDRDGTIIKERHYLSDPNQVELLPSAASGLRKLRELGLGLIIVTNQSPIGRGYFDETRLAQIHQRLEDLLDEESINVAGIYFCPHTPQDHCTCRKPSPGMLQVAAQEFNFALQDCFVVGDKPCDIELGQGVGATTFLVRTGYGAQVEARNETNPDYIVNNLLEMAHTIEHLLTVDERIEI